MGRRLPEKSIFFFTQFHSGGGPRPILWSAGEAFFVPATNALTADCAPEGQKGEALALSRQVGDLGYCLGPLLIGTLYVSAASGGRVLRPLPMPSMGGGPPRREPPKTGTGGGGRIRFGLGFGAGCVIPPCLAL